MDTRPLLFIDSGIGGIPYAHFFYSNNRCEKLIYVADRANFPYGPKSKKTLVELLIFLVSGLVERYDPKMLVVACNAASVSALADLRQSFPALRIVGTVPAIKSAVLASQKRRIGVLGTQRTIEDPYIASLTAQFGPDCTILGEAAAELIDFVEHRWLVADSTERLLAAKPWVEMFLEKGADVLVLACTHFLLLREEFRQAGGGALAVFDSVEGVSKRVESILDEEGLRASAVTLAQAPRILVTGPPPTGDYWKQLTFAFGFSLELEQ